MSSHSLRIQTNPTAVAGSNSEGLDSHGIIQKGIITNDRGLAISDTLLIIHEAYPPLWNLAIEVNDRPLWLPDMTIALLGPVVPPVPGAGASTFLPLNDWVGAAPGAPIAPGDPTTQTTVAAACPAGGFAFFSHPGTVHQLSITANVPAGLDPEKLYRYDFYLSGSLSATGTPRQRFARGMIGLQVQRSTV